VRGIPLLPLADIADNSLVHLALLSDSQGVRVAVPAAVSP